MKNPCNRTAAIAVGRLRDRAASYQQALGSVDADSALPLLARSPVALVSSTSEVRFAGQLFVWVAIELDAENQKKLLR